MSTFHINSVQLKSNLKCGSYCDLHPNSDFYLIMTGKIAPGPQFQETVVLLWL